MKISTVQAYVRAGVSFPFSTALQAFLSANLSKLVDATAFEAQRGAGVDLVIYVSAERDTSEFRLSSARLYRRGRYVECTMFLPFDKVVAEGGTCAAAASTLLEGVCLVLEKVGIPPEPVRKASSKLVKRNCESPKMTRGPWPTSTA